MPFCLKTIFNKIGGNEKKDIICDITFWMS